MDNGYKFSSSDLLNVVSKLSIKKSFIFLKMMLRGIGSEFSQNWASPQEGLFVFFFRSVGVLVKGHWHSPLSTTHFLPDLLQGGFWDKERGRKGESWAFGRVNKEACLRDRQNGWLLINSVTIQGHGGSKKKRWWRGAGWRRKSEEKMMINEEEETEGWCQPNEYKWRAKGRKKGKKFKRL